MPGDYTLSSNVTGITDPGLAAAYLAGEASTEMPLSRFAMLFGWDRGSYDQALIAPPSAYAAVGEGAELSPESLDQVGTSSVTASEYGLAYALSMTSYRTMPRELLLRVYGSLGNYQGRFWETRLADKFNNAEGTTTTAADGLAWGHATHTSAAGNQSNLVNGALSHSTYQTAVQLLRAQKNHRGVLMGGRPTALLVAGNLQVTAGQVLGAGFVEADDRTKINVLAGSADLVVSDDLNDGAWFLFDETQWMSHGGIAVPVIRAPQPTEIPQQELTYRYVVSDRISAGFGSPVDFRGSVVGNT